MVRLTGVTTHTSGATATEEELEEEEVWDDISLRRGGDSITTRAATGSVAMSGEATRVRRWSGLVAVGGEEGAEGI